MKESKTISNLTETTIMMNRVFIDSNIWIYLFTSGDNIKNKTAKEFIYKSIADNHVTVSYQVINEVCCVLKKKSYTESEIRRIADDMAGLSEVCEYSLENIILASMLREQHSFSYWDSQIVASALLSQCDVLASEDMQNGLRVQNLRIISIF